MPILDDHSRYLCALRFLLTKDAETTLLTTYLAMKECGTPAEMLRDRAGRFVDATGKGQTHFQEIVEALGIGLHIAPRAETKGNEERLNQFTERDFLDEVRWQIGSLHELNRLADARRDRYNHSHVHKATHCTPAHKHTAGV